MIARLGRFLSRWAHRVIPDPFVLALGLTLLVIAGGAVRMWVAGDVPPEGVLPHLLLAWVRGAVSPATGKATGGFVHPGLLGFALQMCLVLVTGHALALSPPVQRIVHALARAPRSGPGAAVLVAAVACLAGAAHWGLGAIVGALLAREIARHAHGRDLQVHYPLLGAAAYSGLAVWHGGASGSAPLKVAEAGHFAADVAGVLPVAQTLLSPMNLLITGALLVGIPVLYGVLSPRDPDEIVGPDPDRLSPLPGRTRRLTDTVPGWLEESALVGGTLGGATALLVVAALTAGRLTFDLNVLNLLFLSVGLACQGGVRHYVEAVADGARGAGAIIVQFPFYFGILGVMSAAGLIDWVSQGLVALATETTFPVLAFLSAGLVNLVIPSGGGQWAVQGDILLTAGAALGVRPQVTVMAFSYGDAWTNMLQPFWALPLLGIMRLDARDIIGYTAVIFLAMGVAIPALLLLLA